MPPLERSQDGPVACGICRFGFTRAGDYLAHVCDRACPRCRGPVKRDRVGATVHGGYVCMSEMCPTYGIMEREVLHLAAAPRGIWARLFAAERRPAAHPKCNVCDAPAVLHLRADLAIGVFRGGQQVVEACSREHLAWFMEREAR